MLDHVQEDLGVENSEVLHTAHGLKSDHVPAKDMARSSACIARGDAESEGLEAVVGKAAFT